jgi:hypothetical protein
LADKKHRYGAAAKDTVDTLNANFSDLSLSKADANAVVPLSQKGAINGVATLGPDGKIPADQLNFGDNDNVTVLLLVSAAEPSAGTAGAQYINTTDFLLYTSNGTSWGAGAALQLEHIYIDGATEIWYRWTGANLAPISAAGGGGSKKYVIADDDAGWKERPDGLSYELVFPVTGRGVVTAYDAAGDVLPLLPVNIVSNGAVWICTLIADEPAALTLYVAEEAVS